MAKHPWLSISSTQPVGLSDQIFGVSEFTVLVASIAFGAPALIIGTDLLGPDPGLGLTVSQMVLMAPIGIVIAGSFLAAAAWAAADNGVPTGLLMRPALGVAGSWVAMVLQAAFLVAWSALELDFGGSALVGGMEALGVDGVPLALAVAVLALASIGLIVAGFAWVARVWLYRFAFWGALILAVVLAWQVLSQADIGLLLDETPQARSFWLGVDGVMLLGVIWFPLVADSARFVSSTSAAASGAGSGFSVATLILVLVSGVRAASIGTAGAGPVDLLLDGASSVGAVVIVGWVVVASVDQPFFLAFSGATTLSTISDRFAGRIQAMSIVVVGAAISLLVPRSVTRDITDVIVLFLAQMLAVLLADYFIVRRRAYETDELYEREGSYAGVNLYGLTAVVIGFMTALVLRPVGPENVINVLEPLNRGDLSIAESVGLPPVLVSMLATAFVYSVLGRWKIRGREYLADLRV